MKTLYFTNPLHLGDTIFSMIFFNNIKNYIEKNNIIIDFSCNQLYHTQLKEFIMSPNIIISNVDENTSSSSIINSDLKPIRINIWIGNELYPFNWYNKGDMCMNDFLLVFHNNIINKINIMEQLNIPLLINRFEYNDMDLLTRYDNINNKLNNKYKNIDILIVNSVPLSNQFSFDENSWNNYINLLNTKYKIATTKKVEGVVCTMDDNLTVKDIASISTKCKIIIAVNTGVVPGFYNTFTLDNVKKIYYFDNTTYYSYKNWIKKNDLLDITMDSLDTILNKINEVNPPNYAGIMNIETKMNKPIHNMEYFNETTIRRKIINHLNKFKTQNILLLIIFIIIIIILFI